MNNMDELSTPIREAAHRVEQAWQAAADHWQDATAAHFEQEHWLPLATTTLEYMHAARELEDILTAISALRRERQ